MQANDIAAFQKLFMAKRIEQLAAVKNIQKLDESKRKLLLDQISAKLFQVSEPKFVNIWKVILLPATVAKYLSDILKFV